MSKSKEIDFPEDRLSSLGHNLEWIGDVVSIPDLQQASAEGHKSAGSHPFGASCECVASEIIGTLIDLGYRIKPPKKVKNASRS